MERKAEQMGRELSSARRTILDQRASRHQEEVALLASQETHSRS